MLPEPITWESGISDLCGSRRLCNLIQEGLPHQLKPVISFATQISIFPLRTEGVITQLKVNVQSLEYLKDPGKWVSGKNHAKYGSVFLMVSRRHAVLEQGEVILEGIEFAE